MQTFLCFLICLISNQEPIMVYLCISVIRNNKEQEQQSYEYTVIIDLKKIIFFPPLVVKYHDDYLENAVA